MLEFLRLSLYQLTRFPIQLLCSELLFMPLLKRRKFFWLRLAPCVLLIFLLPIFWPSYATDLQVGSWFSFTYILVFLLVQAAIFFSFHCDIRKILFIGASAYVIQNLLFQSSQLINNLIDPDYFITQPLYAQLVKVGMELLVFALVFFYVHNWQEQILQRLNNFKAIAFTAVGIFLVSVLSNYIMSAFDWNVGLGLLSIIVCILLMVIHLNIFQHEKLELDKEVIDHLLYLSSKQGEDMKRNIESVNIKCHDLKHQIRNFRESNNLSQDEKNYLEDLEKTVRIYDSHITTGNEALDVVLTEKSFICEQENIVFSSLTQGNLLSFMSTNDIYSLFGNALSNAIEAERQIPDGQREVALRVYSKANVVSVHVENYYPYALEFLNGLPQTTKADKENHGFGMLSMKRIVETYGGSFKAFRKDDRFCLDMLFVVESH